MELFAYEKMELSMLVNGKIVYHSWPRILLQLPNGDKVKRSSLDHRLLYLHGTRHLSLGLMETSTLGSGKEMQLSWTRDLTFTRDGRSDKGFYKNGELVDRQINLIKKLSQFYSKTFLIVYKKNVMSNI